MKGKIFVLIISIALSTAMLSGCTQPDDTNGETPTNNDPIAIFSYLIENLTVTFTDDSTDEDDDTLTYSWDFGDDETSTEKDPIHTYTKDNETYTVSLTVDDGQGGTDTKTDTVTIGTPNNVPTADFTYEVDHTTMNVTFTDTSSDLDDDNLTYNWSFGDGETSTDQNPYHVYAENDTYTVMLTVFDGEDTNSKTVDIEIGITPVENQPPEADFQGVAAALVIVFVDFSTDDGEIVSWLWDFDDGETSTLQNTEHIYTLPGTYNVTLTVTDDGGLSDSYTKEFTLTL